MAEMLVEAAGLVTLAVRQTIAQPDFLHTNDAAASHKFTIKLQWHQTLRSSRLVAAICAGRVRERTNRFAAAQSSSNQFNLSWTLSVQLQCESSSVRNVSVS